MSEMVGVYVGSDLTRYGFPNEHPFGSDRHDAFWNHAVHLGLDRQVQTLDPQICNESDLTLFHDESYVNTLKRKSVDGSGYLDYGDTPAFKGVYEASAYVVGSGLDALHRIMRGEHKRIFIPIAGLHHANRQSAAGFCTVSDLGILIQTLREQYQVQRIAYVDIDAHHGDGVFYSYQSDPDIIIGDIHEDGRFLYPGTGFAYETGTESATGTKINLPVMPGSDDEIFFSSWGRLEEFIRQFDPEFILFQAGVDSIIGDPLTHMEFTPKAHGYAAKRLCLLADEYCEGKILATGGGGYNRTNIAHGWCEVVKAMIQAG